MSASKHIVARLSGVSKRYREGHQERTVLDAVDLDIEAGEIVVLLGKSGSGKTTLLNLLAGIDLPDSGSVRLDERALEELDERTRTLLRRHEIGFVFQFFNLIPTLTVEENLLLPLELAGRLDDVTRVHALARLDRMGLGKRAASFPDVLSGGEQQRVAIARALAHDPRLLLADEPTGNLDADTAAEVLAMLETTVREAGATLVMATHSREAATIGDRVLTIRDGQLVEVGDQVVGDPVAVAVG
ncbi:MAG: ABC transporter ATP-binding protein [Acidobacteriota bacterium]